MGKIRLFTVSYASIRHEDGKMYEVSTDLPQWSAWERFTTQEEAQKYCEVRLKKFLAYVNAHMKNSEGD
ncbi:hypothetical protein [Streptomyces sp. 5-10]|uniref:hypothetical protein n=1 Tax=Streptomyces sp. 5-10 TaxID=878925 RepID=UPI00168B5D4C|nr:hypothetical protein [Streptomyces sp. 5-10]MBD3004641.1 hypothetical protein [Streptomyces sp. 5-10]